MSESDVRVPRIFVGTMYCGEHDFAECCDAINSQAGVNVTHHTITDMNEKDAHNALWSIWNACKHNHDLFVKVDADTVLTCKLLDIWKLFESNSNVTGMQAPLMDYMTDGFINGLNAFSPRVVFSETKDDLLCDRNVDSNHNVIILSTMVPECLRPAGLHCFHSSGIQAFRYGVHRALKNQTSIISRVCDAWKKHRDRIRGMALMGIQAAYLFKDNHKCNYKDAELIEAYAEAEKNYEELAENTAPY